jgi:hypothetical protein
VGLIALTAAGGGGAQGAPSPADGGIFGSRPTWRTNVLVRFAIYYHTAPKPDSRGNGHEKSICKVYLWRGVVSHAPPPN